MRTPRMARTQADIAGSDAAAESSVAAAAQRALGCGALVIDRGTGEGRAGLAAAVGIAEADAEKLGSWLAGVEVGLRRGIVDTPIEPDSPAHRLGFRSVSSAAAEVDGERLGTVHALFRHPQRADPALLLAFASHWAVVLARTRLRRQVRLEERRRIADDLHDDVAQLLFAAQMQLEGALERDGIDPAVAARITRARELIARGDTAIRDVITALPEPAPTGLAAQLRELAEGIEEEFGMPIRVEITESGRAAAAETRAVVRETMSKVARESLVNVAKHAGPCEATLRLDADGDRLLMTVDDDGVGGAGDAGDGRHGLSSLRRAVARRGGSLEIGDREGGGTTVAASLPLAGE